MQKVLIVDDELFILCFAESILTGIGCNVVGVTRWPQEALKFVDLYKPDFVLMDINLNDPNCDGIDLAERILKEYNVPSLFVTAYDDDKIIARAQQANPIAFLSKPYTGQMLKTEIDRHFSNQPQ